MFAPMVAANDVRNRSRPIQSFGRGKHHSIMTVGSGVLLQVLLMFFGVTLGRSERLNKRAISVSVCGQTTD